MGTHWLVCDNAQLPWLQPACNKLFGCIPSCIASTQDGVLEVLCHPAVTEEGEAFGETTAEITMDQSESDFRMCRVCGSNI
jgi:hypothetical protein